MPTDTSDQSSFYFNPGGFTYQSPLPADPSLGSPRPGFWWPVIVLILLVTGIFAGPRVRHGLANEQSDEAVITSMPLLAGLDPALAAWIAPHSSVALVSAAPVYEETEVFHVDRVPTIQDLADLKVQLGPRVISVGRTIYVTGATGDAATMMAVLFGTWYERDTTLCSVELDGIGQPMLPLRYFLDGDPIVAERAARSVGSRFVRASPGYLRAYAFEIALRQGENPEWIEGQWLALLGLEFHPVIRC